MLSPPFPDVRRFVFLSHSSSPWAESPPRSRLKVQLEFLDHLYMDWAEIFITADAENRLNVGIETGPDTTIVRTKLRPRARIETEPSHYCIWVFRLILQQSHGGQRLLSPSTQHGFMFYFTAHWRFFSSYYFVVMQEYLWPVWFTTSVATLCLTFLPKVSYSIRTTNLRQSVTHLATNQTGP
jgi:hypothetical protein